METAPKVGDVGVTVAENIKKLRDGLGLSVRALSERLGEFGRPILASGITKIEQGERRVDVDDLVAFAAALNVSPTRLLLDVGDAIAFEQLAQQWEQRHELDTLFATLDALHAATFSTATILALVEWWESYDMMRRTITEFAKEKKVVVKKKGATRGKR